MRLRQAFGDGCETAYQRVIPDMKAVLEIY